MTWTEARRRKSREEYARLYAGKHHQAGKSVTVPEDVTVLNRDPSPCFFCGASGECRHRKGAFGW